MRVTEGVLNGRIAELYNPGMFQEHEEVIVFAREEFNRTYRSIQEQIDYINKVDMHLDRSEEWKLLGYWEKILERIHILSKICSPSSSNFHSSLLVKMHVYFVYIIYSAPD